LKLQCVELLSSFAFNFNLRRYVEGGGIKNATEVGVTAIAAVAGVVGWCRWTVSNPALKAPMISVLETII